MSSCVSICRKIGIVYFLLFSQQSFAWPPTFGAEFNFSNPVVLKSGKPLEVNSTESEAARDKMMEIIKSVCATRGDCSVQTSENHYGVTTHRVKYKDGWWFDIATDPRVVEIQTAPSTVEQLEKYKQRIQEDIFGSAEKTGLSVTDITKVFGHGWAAGHIHIGASSAFDGNAQLFRNFLVDYVNHPELGTGLFSNDWSNAPPLTALPKKIRIILLGSLTILIKEKLLTLKPSRGEFHCMCTTLRSIRTLLLQKNIRHSISRELRVENFLKTSRRLKSEQCVHRYPQRSIFGKQS
jgi:hypothetical protein